MPAHHRNPRFIEVMGALAEASGQTTTPFKEKIYAKALDDLTIEQVEQAAWHIIKTRVFATFPKIGELREAVLGKREEVSALALDKLEKAMARHGAYRSVIFDDPIIHAVVRSMGGWPKICSLPEEEWKFKRKEFEKLYAAFSSRPNSVETPLQLAGIVERDNSARGYCGEVAPVYIGDKMIIESWHRASNKLLGK